ncbi:MAG TPA: hypothetical protein VJQ47_09815 [Steroidobacteraceae bacterium]|nr:hypothetical protein [Steroidobacteraceae bacterium]
MLTPYDEYPVHQAAHPFSYVPSTDYSWDDGYYFGVFSPREQVFLAIGLRVNPNTDMVGGYTLFNWAGRQYTVRFNRAWRRDFSLRVGPFAIEFVEPLRKIRLTLDANASELEFDLLWEGTSPAFLEDHHVSVSRGRRTTDQTRYSQPGHARGSIRFGDKHFSVEPNGWSGSRDHSWGLYAERPPLAPQRHLLPPRHSDGPQRALRFWTVFRSEPYSGIYHLHETADGRQVKMNDVFGTPFGGQMFKGWSEDAIPLKAGRHELELVPGTRMLRRARVFLTDEHGREWRQEIRIASPPWVTMTMGYTPGSWKDGGTFFTYHGSEELALEWDDFDFSKQPMMYTPYEVSGAAARDEFGLGLQYDKPVHGVEYLGELTMIAPDGSRSTGAGQIEFFINGPYEPLGLE